MALPLSVLLSGPGFFVHPLYFHGLLLFSFVFCLCLCGGVYCFATSNLSYPNWLKLLSRTGSW